MTMFDNREKALENKYIHDKEVEFRIVSRRRKLLGLWAASQMRVSEEASLQYALEIVRYGIEDTKEGAVVNRVLADLRKVGVNVSESELREKMDALHEQAKREVVENA